MSESIPLDPNSPSNAAETSVYKKKEFGELVTPEIYTQAILTRTEKYCLKDLTLSEISLSAILKK